MRIEVIYCPEPGDCDLESLQLAEGATLDDAIAASGVRERHALEPDALRKGVWSKVCPGSHVLRDGDRIELYRELTVDPKEARRLRYRGKRDKTDKR